MPNTVLSPRENEIVELSAEGLTNEAIANRLGLSVGTVNTYWLRIKFKIGGSGRTDIVLRIFKKRFEVALKQEKVDWEALEKLLENRAIFEVVVEKEREVELRTRLAMLQLVMDFNHTSAWATDEDLSIHMITNEELPSRRSGVAWEDGKTIYEVFNTDDQAHPAVAAHLRALNGSISDCQLCGEFGDMRLKVVPVYDEPGEIICCISILMKSESANGDSVSESETARLGSRNMHFDKELR